MILSLFSKCESCRDNAEFSGDRLYDREHSGDMEDEPRLFHGKCQMAGNRPLRSTWQRGVGGGRDRRDDLIHTLRLAIACTLSSLIEWSDPAKATSLPAAQCRESR
jgi:hypothetical protein